MMENIFDLNKEVKFIFHQRILCRHDNSVEPVVFNAPSAKILLMLLTREGIITQKELYEFGWCDNGINTTPNNLYQNISLVRRGLKKIFKRDDDYIVTVPRQGFYFNPKITVEPLLPEEDVVEPVHSDMMIKDDEVEVDTAPAADETDSPSLIPDVKLHAPVKSLLQYSSLSYGAATLTAIGLLITVVMLWQNSDNSSPHFFDSYSYYNTKDNCSFYFNDSSFDKRTKNIIVERTLRDCHTHPIRYVSYLNEFSAVSVIACHNEMSDPRHGDGCVSYYYQGLLKNET